MKKTTPIILSTLTLCTGLLGAVSPHRASAFTVDDGLVYWEINELLTLQAEVDAESTALCGDDGLCKEDYLMRLADSRGGIYRALDDFKHWRFMMSSVNPTTGTLGLYYDDVDPMMRRMGIMNGQPLDRFQAFWVEPEYGYDTDVYPLSVYADEIANGTPRVGIHPILSKSTTKDGEGWLTPKTETEFAIDMGSDLELNSGGSIYYYAGFADGNAMIGSINYRSCLESPDYQSDMLCRRVYSRNGFAYLPFAVEVAVETPDPDPIQPEPSSAQPTVPAAPALEQSSTPTTSDATTTREQPENRTALRSTTTPVTTEAVASDIPASDSVASTTDLPASERVEVPVASSNSHCAEIQFPWWLVILLIAGDALVLWWFLPNRRSRK